VAPGEMPIVPLLIGDPALAMRVCEAAIERGVFAQAIRPPTVPAGTSRLRVAVMSSHRRSELRQAAGTLADAARACGVEPTRGVTPREASGRPFDVEAPAPLARAA